MKLQLKINYFKIHSLHFIYLKAFLIIPFLINLDYVFLQVFLFIGLVHIVHCNEGSIANNHDCVNEEFAIIIL